MKKISNSQSNEINRQRNDDKMNNPIEEFKEDCKREIEAQGNDQKLKGTAIDYMKQAEKHKYSYHFTWMGRPIIQFPEDIVAMQELIWEVKPDLIIETGIAHGGSILYYASILELLGNDGLVVGVDIDIRKHNRAEIEKHPMYKRVQLIEGSSIDQNIVDQVKVHAKNRKKIMVILDSCHTHEHVLAELELYSPLVTKGSYLVVFDTIVDDMPEDVYPDRPWGGNNNPKTAVKKFLKQNDRFVAADEIDNKLLISVAPSGYLKCVKD